MANFRHIFCAGLIVFGLAGSIGASHGAVETACYADWSEAGPVARKQELIPVSGILKAVRAKRDGRVARVQLCRVDKSFHYRVAIFGTGGALSWLKVNAHTGRIQTLVRP